uniref:Uncharacterized protein n=1 Tax=Siphoviridae sp. ctaDn21 TaxID=2825563 RepID=A0A8S5UV37_9CAUD|nr:MAG TPA: hypothetical protein [Siphoviridae sp. ctaDn21]
MKKGSCHLNDLNLVSLFQFKTEDSAGGRKLKEEIKWLIN